MSCSTRTMRCPACPDRRDNRIEVVDHQRRETEADLVVESKPRIGQQPAAQRDHLLLTARKVARPLAAALQQHGNSRQMSDRPISPFRPTCRPRVRDSPRRSSDGNSRLPSGTSAISPEATIAAVERRARSTPANRMFPSTRSACPTIAVSSVDLPAPLAPMIATISPAATVRSTRSTARN